MPILRQSHETPRKQPLAVELSPTSWALLCLLHRAAHGGPRPPDGGGAFDNEFAELRANDLIKAVGNTHVVTETGETALRERFLDC